MLDTLCFVPLQLTSGWLEFLGKAQGSQVLCGHGQHVGLLVGDLQARLLSQQQQVLSVWTILWAPRLA